MPSCSGSAYASLGSDEAIQETTPVMRRARRKAPARIQHAGRTHNTAVTSKRKRKAESPVPEVDEDYYDGKSSPVYPKSEQPVANVQQN